MTEGSEFARDVAANPPLLREVLAEPTNFTIGLRPSQCVRLLAYQRRFVDALTEATMDLEDVTPEECILTLLDGALEQDEHKHRLASDFVGNLRPYPLWRQALVRLQLLFNRVRRVIKKAFRR